MKPLACLEPSDLRRLSGISLVTERTVRRVLEGEAVRPLSREHVRSALRALATQDDDARIRERAGEALAALANGEHVTPLVTERRLFGHGRAKQRELGAAPAWTTHPSPHPNLPPTFTRDGWTVRRIGGESDARPWGAWAPGSIGPLKQRERSGREANADRRWSTPISAMRGIDALLAAAP